MRVESLENRTLLSSGGLTGTYFGRNNFTNLKLARIDSSINFDWSSHLPSNAFGQSFSVRWDGQIEPSSSGNYTFTIVSTGGVRLWIGTTQVINDWNSHSQTQDQGSINLSAGKKYNIRIDYRSDGNGPEIMLEWSGGLQTLQVVPASRLIPDALESTPPTTPGKLKASSVTQTSLKLSWNASTDRTGIVAYNILRGSNQIGTTAPGVTSFTVTGLSAHTKYGFSVRAIDPSGNTSGAAATTVTTSGSAPGGTSKNQPPTIPANLHVTSTTDDSVSLTWSASSDDVAISGYRVYRNGVKIAQPRGTSYTDSNLSANTQYTYQVRAVDNVDAYSGFSASVKGKSSAAPSNTRNAFSSITASSYDDSSGVVPNGTDLNDIDDGDWVKYSNVDFGSSGAQSVTLQIALPQSNQGGTMELHLDSLNGPLIASHQIQPSGDWNTYNMESLDVSDNGSPVTGTHDLYILFKNTDNMANLRSIQFSTTHLVNVWAVGDSITAGWANSPNYRYYLWNMLQQAGKSVDFVGTQIAGWNGGPPNFNFDQNHDGYAGITAEGLASEAASLAAQVHPDIVLLHAGSNDMEQGNSVQNTLNALSDIISAIRSVNPNVTILMAQLIPEANPTVEAGIDQLNAQIPSLAASLNTAQSPVIAVPVNSGVTTSDLGDGVHPIDSGDQKMATNWYNALAPLLP